MEGLGTAPPIVDESVQHARSEKMVQFLPAFILVVTVIACARQTHGKEQLPNIVFMMADDLGYGDVGYNGANATTPNLDAMAGGPNTLHLTRYYSGGPVCSPTRGTLLTGRNHNRFCVWNANTGSNKDDFVVPEKMPLPTTEVTVAEVLKRHGYQTAMFGKWHLGDFKALPEGNKKWPISHPGMHGFDEWWGTERSAQSANLNCACFNDSKNLCVMGHYDSLPPCFNYYTVSDSNTLEGIDHPLFGDDTHYIVGLFEEYLEKATKSDKPFFVYLPFHTVHIRYLATEGYIRNYTKLGYSEAEIDYFGAISAMDDAIGKVRNLLRQYNVSNNTMLWFTSDNGPAPGQPGVTAGFRGRKGTLYEGGIRVPGLIEWPDMIKKNVKSDYPVMSTDLLPTACDIVGTTPPSDRPIDGVSIMPLVNGSKTQRNSSMKWAFRIPNDFDGSYNAVISDNQYKIFASYKKGKVASAELYDLLADPFETKDVSGNKTEVYHSMLSELEHWRQSVIKSATKEVKCYGVSVDDLSETFD